jgi:hypothetical protein
MRLKTLISSEQDLQWDTKKSVVCVQLTLYCALAALLLLSALAVSRDESMTAGIPQEGSVRRPLFRFAGLMPALVVALVASSFASSARSSRTHDMSLKPGLSADQLAQEVVQNELQAQERDKNLWSYRKIREENGRRELLEVVGTTDGEVHRLLSINGVPLNEQESRREEQRIRKLVASPDEFRERQNNAKHDAAQERTLLTMLPQAFLYEYDGTEGELIKLRFRPNPDFRPIGHESEVFHHMEGIMSVDRRQNRLAELDGRLMSEVKFWDGLLGHLDKGGTFSVRQSNVDGDHWEMTVLDVNMNGKALFLKTIAVREREVDSDFHLLPEDTSLRQAAVLLKVSLTG